MENKYQEHLIQCLERNKKNELRQFGKSDIDPPDYIDQVHKWYDCVLSYVVMNSPKYYVKEILVVELSNGEIKSVEYNYCNEKEYYDYVSVVIKYEQ